MARGSCSSGWVRRSRSCGSIATLIGSTARSSWTVGALFDYVSGHTPRAPRWLADNGLEWIFRLAIEPERMWRRYLLGNPVFLSRVLSEARRQSGRLRLTGTARRRGERWLAVLILVALAALAWHFNARPRHEAFSALPDTLRALAAAVVVFGRRRLRTRPAAAASAAAALRAAVGAADRRVRGRPRDDGARLRGRPVPRLARARARRPASRSALYAVRTRGAGRSSALDRLGWPAYLSFVVLVVALVPMLFVQHYAAPVGTGSDAHLAAGTGEFLKHAYPTGTNIHTPVNQMPPTWTSKYPIYYALAAVSSLSGLATWQVLAPLAAAMLALAAIGMFLVAREVFRALRGRSSLVAMALAGLDRMALYTMLNPYFNQTWGFFAMPFTVVLGWWTVQPGESWRRAGGGRSCCWRCSRSCSRSPTRSRCRSRRSRSSCSCGPAAGAGSRPASACSASATSTAAAGACCT